MTETVRAFLAIELPAPVRAALAEVSERLRQVRLEGVMSVSPESVHITLKFLGDVEHDNLVRVQDAVTSVAERCVPFTVITGRVGAFPNSRGPRVVWVGIECAPAALANLHEQLEEALVPLGFSRERRGFTPHLTVARIRGTVARTSGPRATELASDAWRGADLRVPVESILLFRSLLSPRGARHIPLSRIGLGGGKPPFKGEPSLFDFENG